jgi:hypothetical protein
MGSGQNVRDFSYGFHTIELVVEHKAVSDTIGYDPCPESVHGSSNPVPVDVLAQSNPQTVQNQDNEDEQCHIDIEGDADGLNMEEIEKDIDVENMIHE